jgi:glycine oxidase
MRVTVIGAGVAGLATATELSERGCAVEVVERAPALGLGACSWQAGGMLAPWCERESAEELVAELGGESLDWWPRHHGGVARMGSLVLASRRDEPDLERFARRTRNYRRLDPAGIAALEPDLAGRFGRALYFPEEAHLEPRAALASLAHGLTERGVPIRFGITVEDVAGPVVDCRGFAAQDRLPDLRGVKGEMVVVRCPEVTLARPVRLLHPRFPLYVVPRPEGVFMIGATMIESEERGRVTARSVVELLNAAYALHPAFAEAEILELGCDVRPAFPDNLPRIRRQGERVLVNGLFRHGFLLAPALARRVAAVVMERAVFPEVMDAGDRQQRTS